MGKTLDFILTFGSLIVGIMLVTGHGSIFMKGGNADNRQKLYDEQKVEKASGIALIVIGILTGVDSFTTTVAAKISYVVAVFVIFGILVWYMKAKCRKK